MENEDLNGLPTCGDSGYGHETNERHNSNSGTSETDYLLSNSENKKVIVSSENLGHKGDAQYEDSHCKVEANLEKNFVDNHSNMETEDFISNSAADEEIELNSERVGYADSDMHSENHQCIQEADLDKDLVDNPSIMQVSVELTETVTVEKELNSFSSRVPAENGCLAVRDESLIGNQKMDGSSISGVKRARMAFDEQQPSVRVVYNSLTRASRQKLEELLQQWSEWHAQHGSLSKDANEVLQSGEETVFPALHVGKEKTSAVSFWMDNQTRKQQNKEFIPLDGNSVPLYDRGYALGLSSAVGSSNVEGGLEIIDDASRCFNCGSYNHALKECPKPRDSVAVSNARKQRKSRRNQNAGSRNPTRYYQDTPGGKYDGLRPGALYAETRKLLGLGELDPPPWLNRMREMGYPPGYLDLDDNDQPSGITIFADEEVKDEQEDGEIIEAGYSESRRKKTVEFPGVNAPIPEKADERRWLSGSSSSDLSKNRLHHRSNHYSEPVSRGHHHEQRWSRKFRDDGPPGVDPTFSPSMSSYPPRYVGFDSSYSSHSPRGNIPRPRSPTFGRSQSDRGRGSSSVHESPFNHSSFSSSPQDYGSGRFENRTDEHYQDFSSHWKDVQDRHHYRSRR